MLSRLRKDTKHVILTRTSWFGNHWAVKFEEMFETLFRISFEKSCWKTEKNHFCTNLSRHQQENNQLLIGFCLDNNFRSKFFGCVCVRVLSLPLQLGSDSLETCWWSYFWIKVFLRIDGKWVFVCWPSSVVSKNWYLLESVNYILASRISLRVLQSTFDFVEHFFVTNGKGLVHFGRNSSETLNWPFF